jgi:hypothetical protein
MVQVQRGMGHHKKKNSFPIFGINIKLMGFGQKKLNPDHCVFPKFDFSRRRWKQSK